MLLASAVFMAFDLTELDRMFSNMFFDSMSGVFPIGQNHLFEKITHKWTRVIPNWTGGLAIIGALLSFIWPHLEKRQECRLTRCLVKMRVATPLRFVYHHRLDFFFIIIAFALSTGVVHYFKSHTSIYCPVETTIYGGSEIRKEWFENFTLWSKAGSGRCWPGGHASGAFCMFALYFIARRYRWRYSNVLLGGVILLGLIYGTTRVLQGWHYMSHTLWSGIFVWLSTLLVALVFYGRAALQQPVLRPVERNVSVTEQADPALTP